MEINRNKLRARIIEIYGTQGAFAKAIGRTEQTVTAKLNGRRGFSQEDIIDWSNALYIRSTQLNKYFFARKVSKT